MPEYGRHCKPLKKLWTVLRRFWYNRGVEGQHAVKRKYFRLPLLMLCAALALGLLAVGLSHAVYGRSLRASVYEIMLRRRFASERTPEEERQRLEARRAEGEKPCVLPKSLSFKSRVEEAEREGMQVFTLNGDGLGDTDVLYLHGGAYIISFNAYQWRFMDALAASANCRVIAPAYHLAPYADYEQAYSDLLGLYREISAEGRRLILMGDSAGGGLALGLAEALARAGEPLPGRLILFSPWADVSMTNPDIAKYVPVDPILHLNLVKVHGQYWAGDAGTKHWQVSPLYGDMEGLPPVTLYCGTRELLYPDILLLNERLTAAGVKTDLHVARGLNHDYPLMPIPEGKRAVAEVVKLVRGE